MSPEPLIPDRSKDQRRPAAGRISDAGSLSTTLPLEGGAWDAPRAFWRVAPRAGPSLEERLTELELERELRDFYSCYFDALDSRELEPILGFFHDDAVYVGDDRRFVGKAAIRRFYETDLPTARATAHNAGNVAVRMLGDDEACINSRNFTVICQESNRMVGVAANVTLRVVNPERWLIAERRTSVIATYLLTPHSAASGSDDLRPGPDDQ